MKEYNIINSEMKANWKVNMQTPCSVCGGQTTKI